MCCQITLHNNYHLFISDQPQNYQPHHHHENDQSSYLSHRQPFPDHLLNTPLHQCSPVVKKNHSRDAELIKSTSLTSRSHSPSPTINKSVSAWEQSTHEYYGSANLMDRSRSPSPASLSQCSHLSHKQGRQLPRTPRKPTTLPIAKKPSIEDHMPKLLPSPTYKAVDGSPSSINFPRVSDSPSERGSVVHSFFPIESLSSVTGSNDLNRGHLERNGGYANRARMQQQLPETFVIDPNLGRQTDRIASQKENKADRIDVNQNPTAHSLNPTAHSHNSSAHSHTQQPTSDSDEDWC